MKTGPQNALRRIMQGLWSLAIISLPWGKFVLLSQLGGPGRYNPYASPVIHMSDLAILGALGLWGIIENKKFKKLTPTELGIGIGLLMLTLIPGFWAEHPALGAYGGLQIILALGVILMIREKVLPPKISASLFVGVMSLEALWGGIQLALGDISNGESGLAKLVLGGEVIVRAQGSFSHPNILAGYLLVALALIPWIAPKLRTPAKIFLLLGIIATFSKAAWIGALIALAIAHRKKLKKFKKGLIAGAAGMAGFFIFLTFQNPESITERWELLSISGNMLLQRPWGIGPHHFTLALQQFTETKMQPWEFQPVHNAYLLLANERGIWMGLLAFLGVLHLGRTHAKESKAFLWFPLVVVTLFDHYLVSLTQGILLTAWATGWTVYEGLPKTVRTKSG